MVIINKELETCENMCIPQASQEGYNPLKKTTDYSSNDDAPIASLRPARRKRVRKYRSTAAAPKGATPGAQAQVPVKTPSGGDPPTADHERKASPHQI
jgi:hypothetical protein